MGRGWTKLAAGSLALVLVAGVGACGNDDDSTAATTSTTASSSASKDPFCTAVLDFNKAVTNVEVDETTPTSDIVATGQHLVDLFGKVLADVPDDLASTAHELDGTLQSLAQGDPSQFADDATYAKYTDFLGGAVDHCDLPTVDVTGVDYAFEGMPAKVDAGTVAFTFTNAAKDETHEMVILRKKDGVTESWDDLLALPEDQAQAKTEYQGSVQEPPGGKGTTVAELSPGSYLLACFLPVGGAEDGQPHFMKGMKQEFTVE